MWLTRLGGPGVGIASSVALCLTGFAPDQEVSLSVQGGGRTVLSTAAVREATAHRGSVSSLFTAGATLELMWSPSDGSGPGLMESSHWALVPPREIREALTVTRKIRITAGQGGLTATRTMMVDPQDGEPFRWFERSNAGDPILLITGFSAGTRVPVGLYRKTGTTSSEDGPAQLVRRLGEVTFGRSGAELFLIPTSVTSLAAQDSGRYCLTVPLREQFQVPCLPQD